MRHEDLRRGWNFYKRVMEARGAFISACLATQNLNRASRLWDEALAQNRFDLIPNGEYKNRAEELRAWNDFRKKLSPEEREKVDRFLTAPISAESGWEVIPNYFHFFNGGPVLLAPSLKKGKLHFFFFPESWLSLLREVFLASVVYKTSTKVNLYTFLQFRLWVIACGIVLHILGVKKKKEEQEDYDRAGATLIHWGLYGEEPPPQYLGRALRLCFQNQERIAGLDDIQSQVKLLEDFKKVIPGLEEFCSVVQLTFSCFSQLLHGELNPVKSYIFTGVTTEDEEVVAQMGIWAYRQTKEEAYCNYLFEYIEKFLKKEDHTDVVYHVLSHWHSPASQYSFANYIKRVTSGLREGTEGREITVGEFFTEEEWEDDGEVIGIPRRKRKKKFCPPPPFFPMPLVEAPFYLSSSLPFLSLSNNAIYRRLMRAAKRGILPCEVKEECRITKDGMVIRRKKFFLSEEGFRKAGEFLWETETRRAIINRYREESGLTRRSAERWLKRHLDQGKTLKEIYGEIVKEHQKGVVGDAKNTRRCS